MNGSYWSAARRLEGGVRPTLETSCAVACASSSAAPVALECSFEPFLMISYHILTQLACRVRYALLHGVHLRVRHWAADSVLERVRVKHNFARAFMVSTYLELN